VLTDETGMYVVMKHDQREASVTPFEQAAVTLRRRLLKEKQDAFDREFRRNVLKNADVEINAERAAALSLPATPPPPQPPVLRPVSDWATGP